jgi:hypothetical protein
MPEDNRRDIRIGEETLTIQPFRGYKAVKAGQIIGSAMDAVRTILDEVADFRNEYGERHKLTVTRQMNRARDLGWPDKSFEDGDLVLPEEPSDQQVIGFAFPRIMALADEQLIGLLALALIPNRELRNAYDDGDVEPALKDWRKRVMFDAELPQLIELTGKVADLLREELEGLGAQVGKLRDLVMGPTTMTSESSESTSQTSTSPEAEGPSDPSPPTTTTEDSPASSTDSDEPTDGPPTSPSLASSGAPSSTSESG